MGYLDAAGVVLEERAAVIEEIVDLARPVLSDEEGTWTADYVRLRFRARRAE